MFDPTCFTSSTARAATGRWDLGRDELREDEFAGEACQKFRYRAIETVRTWLGSLGIIWFMLAYTHLYLLILNI